MTNESSLLRMLLKRKWVLVANLVILLALGWNFSRELTRSQSLEGEISRLEQNKAELELKNSELAQVSRELATSSALEREAREKLGLQLPGENVVVIKDHIPESSPNTLPNEEVEISREKTNALRWWNYFFGNNN